MPEETAPAAGGAAAGAPAAPPAPAPDAKPASAAAPPPVVEAKVEVKTEAPPAKTDAKADEKKVDAAALEAEKKAATEKPPEKPLEPAKTEPVKPADTVAAEIELKIPEGVKFDPRALDEFKSVAKATGMSSAQANALVEFQSKQDAAAKKAFTESVQRQRVADLEALKGDKEFGGAKYDRTIADARRAAKHFGGEEFSRLVEAAGLDCHPAFVKTLARAAAAIAEDNTRPPPADNNTVKKPPPMTQQQALAQRYLPKT